MIYLRISQKDYWTTGLWLGAPPLIAASRQKREFVSHRKFVERLIEHHMHRKRIDTLTKITKVMMATDGVMAVESSECLLRESPATNRVVPMKASSRAKLVG